MTNSNNGKTIALVVIVVVLALFAFRSVFFFLPFGVLPGIARSAGEAGPSISGFFHGFGPIGRLALFLLPAAFIILWGAVLIWVYRDAEKRGMSGILWLLLVLIGNVIGLLIYAIVRSETPMRRQDRGEPAAPAPVEPAREVRRLRQAAGARLRILPLLREGPEEGLPGLRQAGPGRLEGLPGLRRGDRPRRVRQG